MFTFQLNFLTLEAQGILKINIQVSFFWSSDKKGPILPAPFPCWTAGLHNKEMKKIHLGQPLLFWVHNIVFWYVRGFTAVMNSIVKQLRIFTDFVSTMLSILFLFGLWHVHTLKRYECSVVVPKTFFHPPPSPSHPPHPYIEWGRWNRQESWSK
jgi:hypothetical protein